MTNLNLYKIFCEVAKQSNITKASVALYISQPAVSEAIKELEHSLGGTLFIRQNKGVILSSYGKELYDIVNPMIEKFTHLDHFFKDVNNMKSGILKIGSDTSNTNQIISKYLIKFCTIYPNVKIKMIRATRQKLLQDLHEQNLDIIYIDNFNFDNYKIIETYSVDYQLIGDKYFFDLYKDNPVGKTNFPINQIILPNNTNSSRQIIDNYLTSIGIDCQPKYEVDNYNIIFDMVKSGLGIAFVNVDYYKNHIGKDVFLINSNLKLSARKISAICLNNNKNPTLAQFVDVITD